MFYTFREVLKKNVLKKLAFDQLGQTSPLPSSWLPEFWTI